MEAPLAIPVTALDTVTARVVSGTSPALGVPMYSGTALMIAAPLPFVLGSIPRLINARTAPDGEAVLVQGADPQSTTQAHAVLREVG